MDRWIYQPEFSGKKTGGVLQPNPDHRGSKDEECDARIARPSNAAFIAYTSARVFLVGLVDDRQHNLKSCRLMDKVANA